MRGIHKAFGATRAVDGVDVSVFPGEVCAIVGQNGAGKSTLMAILSGALQQDAGSMVLDGAPYQPGHPLDARRAGVAMIYQELSLAPHLSVAENILLGMEPATFGLIRRADMRQTAREVLARLGHPEISVDAPVAVLSPAAQQLVEIGRALAVGCRVLVLDEPTSSLTQADTQRLFALIAELKRTGHAIVYISHFIEEVKEVADRIVVLRDGQVAGGGIAADMAPADIVRAHGGPAGGCPVSAIPSSSGRADSRRRGLRAVRCDIHVAPRRDSRDCRSARRRAHAVDSRALRTRAGTHRPSTARRMVGRGHTRPTLGHGVWIPQRGSQGRGTRRGTVRGRQHDALAARGPRPRTAGPATFAGSRRDPMDRSAAHQDSQSTASGCRAVRRQSAEGGHRAAAPPRRRRPASRRAHSRHRRRQQGADLRAHRRARGRAPDDGQLRTGREWRAARRADDQQLCAGTAWPVRSDCRDVPWPSGRAASRSPASPSTA